MRRPRRRLGEIAQQPWRELVNPHPPLRLISEDALQDLIAGAYDILERIGIRCPVPEAQEILREAGALIGGDHRIRIGREIVATALASSPESFALTPRNPARAVRVGGPHLTTAAVLGPPNVTDRLRGRRSGTSADFAELLKLTQYFNAVQMNGWPVEPLDVEVRFRHLEAARAMLTLTDKVPYVFCQSRQRIIDVLNLAAIARGETLEAFAARPGIFSIINTNTPLQYDVPMTIGVIEMARHGQPTLITPFTIGGAATPATIASIMAVNTAEVLFGVTLAQLVRPGAPVLYGSAATNVDMKTGAPGYGSADMFKCTIIGGQIARALKLPMRTSNFSGANGPDFVSGIESAGSVWMGLAAGAHLVMHAAGWVEGGLCTSYEKFVLDCEIIQSLAHYLAPVEVSADSLALDDIAEVGPGGHFFGTPRTIATYETAFYRPLVAQNQNYGAWVEAGAKDAAERATALWQEALRQYDQPPLDPARREAMDAFVAKRIEEGGAEIL